MNKSISMLGAAFLAAMVAQAAQVVEELPLVQPGETFQLKCDSATSPAAKMIDFGPDGIAGYPQIEFASVRGKARVRLAYSCLPECGRDGDFTRATSARYLGPAVDLPILPANIDRFDDFSVEKPGIYAATLQQGLLRYVRVELASPGSEVAVKAVRFENRGTYSTEPIVGRFSCSDKRLSELWRASVRTCQMAAIPARTEPLKISTPATNVVLGTTYAYLSDGAKRDRLVWSGDLWWGQLNMYAAYAPTSPYLPGSLRMLVENQTPAGYVQACPYPESHGPILSETYGPFQSDEFAAWLVPVLAVHYLHTGDAQLVRELYPAVKRLMAYLARHTVNGIFEQRAETSKHANDLAFGESSTHHRALMNVLLWRAGLDAAMLARAVGDIKAAEAFERDARKTEQAVRTRFLLPSGALKDSLENPKLGAEANAVALAAGFFTAAEAKAVFAILPRISHGKFQLLSVRAAFRYGLAEVALKRLHAHNWLKIVDPAWRGVRMTSECMNFPMYCNWGDEAHPDTAMAGDLTEGLLGVAPTAPGFRRCRFTPGAAPGIDWAEGEIPTPFGPIVAKWHRENGVIVKDIQVPPGVMCDP